MSEIQLSQKQKNALSDLANLLADPEVGKINPIVITRKDLQEVYGLPPNHAKQVLAILVLAFISTPTSRSSPKT